jgi:hypothetical protein
MFLSFGVCEPLTYNEPAVTVDEDVVARCIATFVEVAYIYVALFSESHASPMRFLCHCRVLAIVSRSVLLNTELDEAPIVKSLKFPSPTEEVIWQAVEFLRSRVEFRFFIMTKFTLVSCFRLVVR